MFKFFLVSVYKIISPISFYSIKSMTHVSIWRLFLQKIVGFNRVVPWPVHFTSLVTHPNNVIIGEGSYPGFMPGIYIQGTGGIKIGKYCVFAPNVGVISANHDLYDLRSAVKGSIEISDYCWIGMNSTIMPNVKLGKHTIVGSNSVVTKSFEEGYCVIAGNPAKIIKKLDKNNCIDFNYDVPYVGFKKVKK